LQTIINVFLLPMIIAWLFALAPVANADVCNPGKHNAKLQNAKQPIPAFVNIQQTPAKDRKEINWQKRLQEVEAELGNADLTQKGRANLLSRAAYAARQLDKYIEYQLAYLNTADRAVYSHELKNISKTLYELERFEEAYTWSVRWFEQAPYVFEEDHQQLAHLAERLGHFDIASLHIKCQFPTRAYYAPTEYAELTADLIRLAAKSDDLDEAAKQTDLLLGHIEEYMAKNLLSVGQILQRTQRNLNLANYTVLTQKISTSSILEDVDAKIKTLETYDRRCRVDEADSCLKVAEILRLEPNFRDRYKSALEKACTLQRGEGCYRLGVELLANGGREERQRAQLLFLEECENLYKDACHKAGQFYDTQIGKNANEDIPKAITFYKKGCDLNSSEGCYLLGRVYDAGSLGAQDYDKAQMFYGMACELGHSQACSSQKYMRRRP